MRKCHVALASFLILSIYSGTAQPADDFDLDSGEELTLEKSVQIGVESASSVQKGKIEIAISGSQLLQNYGQFLPNLAISGGYNWNLGKTYSTSVSPARVETINSGLNFQILSSLNIFNGFADISNFRALIDRKSASELSLKRAKQLITLDISQTFIQCVLDRKLVKIANENFKVSKAREELLRQQSQLGSKKRADLLRQEAQTSQDEALFLSTMNRARANIFNLIKKLRLDSGKPFHVAELRIDETWRLGFEVPESEAIKLALKSRPDVIASEKNYAAALSDIKASRSGLFPRLDFVFSTGGSARFIDYHVINGSNSLPTSQRSIGDQLGDQWIYSLGLTMTWNIFDRFLTKTSEEKANLTSKKIQIENEDLRNSVVADVRQAYGEYRLLARQVDSAKKGLSAARQAYDVIKAQFDLGSSNFIDLASAQAGLLQAESSFAQAVLGLELQVRVIKSLLGNSDN